MFKTGIWNSSRVCAAITFSASSNYNNKLLDATRLEKPHGTRTGTEEYAMSRFQSGGINIPVTRHGPRHRDPIRPSPHHQNSSRTHNTGSCRPRPHLPPLARRFARARRKSRARGDTRRLTNRRRRRRRSCPFVRILEHPTRISLHRRLTRHGRRSAQR